MWCEQSAGVEAQTLAQLMFVQALILPHWGSATHRGKLLNAPENFLFCNILRPVT